MVRLVLALLLLIAAPMTAEAQTATNLNKAWDFCVANVRPRGEFKALWGACRVIQRKKGQAIASEAKALTGTPTPTSVISDAAKLALIEAAAQ